jgi:competence protein ComEC
MRQRQVRRQGLLAAAVVAVATVLAVRCAGLPGAACAMAAAACWTAHAGRVGGWLIAWPVALLAAAGRLEDQCPQAGWPRPGPVRVTGACVERARIDEVTRALHCLARVQEGRLLLILHGVDAVPPGDRIDAVGTLSLRASRTNRGQPPVVDVPAEACRIRRAPGSLARSCAAAQRALRRSLLAALPPEDGPLLCSLVLGSGPPMDDDLVAAHRSTGLSHLLAVSGAQVSLLAFLLSVAFAACQRQTPWLSRRFSWTCAAAVLGYGAVTGFEPPVFRALAACLVLLAGRAFGRTPGTVGPLAVPAVLTCLLAPDDVLGISFALSYAAVIGLTLAGTPPPGRSARWLAAPLLASAWATLATAPLTLWYFGQVAPWTILATPLLSPLVAMMLAMGLVCALLGLLDPGLAAVLGAPLAACARLYAAAVELVAAAPCTPVFARCAPAPAAIVGLGLIAAAALWRWPNRVGIACACAALCVPHALPPPPVRPRLHLLAVGHGQACAVAMEEATVLIDCGGAGRGTAAAARVLEALRPRRPVDLLVLTHADHDHVNGARWLLQSTAIAAAAMPAEMLAAPIARQLAAAGARLLPVRPGAELAPLPGVRVTRPALARASASADNDASLWVRVDLGSFTALVPGDAEEAGVRAWLRSPGRCQADVLVLPHHGRANGAAADLLAAVGPDLALVSDDEGAPPSPQGEAAARAGIRVLHTGEVGSIRIDAGEPPLVSTEWPIPTRRHSRRDS